MLVFTGKQRYNKFHNLRNGELVGQAERKVGLSTREPDLDNANVGR